MDRYNIQLVGWFIFITLLLFLSRVVPHPPNFTPIIAVAAFWPTVSRTWYISLCCCLLAMFLGDLYFGLHSYMIWTYGSLAIISLLRFHYFINGVLGSVIFYALTNFGVWTSGYYGYTFEGLIACYIAAIPFFTNTIISTVFFILVFNLLNTGVQRWEAHNGKTSSRL